MKKRLIMTLGLSGSGKSTWAKEFAKENNFKIIERDLFREQILKQFKLNWSRENEDKIIIPHWVHLIETTLKTNNVIVADTNLSRKARNILKHIAEKNKIQLEVKSFLDVPIEVCIDRDLRREEKFKIGEKKIRKRYKDFVLPILREQQHFKFNDISENYEKSKLNKETKYIICDIDGTVANMLDRDPFAWNKVGSDKPIHQVIDMLKSFQKAMGYKVIFVSGRDAICREETNLWLKEVAKVEFEDLFMRPEKDHRPDFEIKKEIYENHLKDKINIAFVIDDRPQVVKVWRDLGLFVFDVNQSGLDF